MKTSLVLALLMLASGAASAEVQQLDRKYYDPVDSGGGGSVVAHVYQGTANTLPYGHTTGWDPGLVTHAFSMPSVQRAMDAMARRGYVRRADLDAGVTVDGYSTVSIAYEKPGAPVAERMPVVHVITQPFYVSSVLRWVPATQVACGMLEDSTGVIQPTCTPADSAIVIEGVDGTSPLPPGDLEAAIIALAPEWFSDEDINYRYTAHDQFFPQDWRETTSRGMQILWNEWGDAMGVAMTEAAVKSSPSWTISPPVGAGTYMSAATIAAFASANVRFWRYPPDTSGGR